MWLPPSVTGPPKSSPPPNKLPIQINIPYNLNSIYVVIRNNNSVKLYDDFKEQRKIMGFSEMVVPASYAPIFLIVFESCPSPPPPRDGQIIPPRLGTTALERSAFWERTTFYNEFYCLVHLTAIIGRNTYIRYQEIFS